MPKLIHYEADARARLKLGIDKLANAVKVTLGPRGRNVAIEKKFGGPTVTKDGVTVAKEIELEDSYHPAEHDAFFRRFGWREFTPAERDLVPPVLVLGHTGVTAWDDVFRLLARRYPINVVVVWRALEAHKCMEIAQKPRKSWSCQPPPSVV